MGRTNAPVTTTAVLVAVYAAWHFTGGLHGTVVHVHTPPAASSVTTTAVVTSQCEPLPTPAPSASPSTSLSTPPTATASASSTASTSQLCVNVQAAQDSIAHGKTETWTINLQAEGGPATSVIVTLAGDPVGLTPNFTGSCPSGGGTPVCTLGDMGTAVTPASYQLQAQVTIPANSTATAVTATASAATSPSMAADPAAGQTVTITGAAAKASSKASSKPSSAKTTSVPTKPATTAATQPAVAPASQPAVVPVAPVSVPPIVVTAPAAGTTTVSPGNVGNAIPQISPIVATAPAPATTIVSSPAANIQAAAPSPSGDMFSISIGMSAQTAQVLGWILLALVVTLVASKLTSNYMSRNRPARSKEPRIRQPASARRRPRFKLPALPFSRPHLPSRSRHPRPNRDERRTTREQNWRRYLESQQPPAAGMEKVPPD
jgi:hypothetical protein